MSSSTRSIKDHLLAGAPKPAFDESADGDVGPGLPREPAPEVLDQRPRSIGVALPHLQMRKDRSRLARASWAFTTRRVASGAACRIVHSATAKPRAGDLVLARVDSLGHHKGLQLTCGRRRTMFVGDEIVVAYGNRYASSQFEAYVPDSMGPCHLVAGGGIASRAVSWHGGISRGPTHITPIGLLADKNGQRLNLHSYRLPDFPPATDYRPTTLAVIGTSMDAGKTTAAAHLTRGLIAAGLRVGYAKITGTGAGGDIWLLKDAGADPVVDFTDAGLASTYLADIAEVERVMHSLIGYCTQAGVDAIVMEIADGVFQKETAELLKSREFARCTGGIVLAAQDSMGAAAGISWLRDLDTPVVALSGKLTAAPLQIAEATAVSSAPILKLDELGNGRRALHLLGEAQHHQSNHSTVHPDTNGAGSQ
jgi:hypothetical protein